MRPTDDHPQRGSPSQQAYRAPQHVRRHRSDLKRYFRAQTPFLGRWVAPVHEYHRLLAHALVAVRVDHLITPPHHESIAGYAPANTPLIALPNTCPVAEIGRAHV